MNFKIKTKTVLARTAVVHIFRNLQTQICTPNNDGSIDIIARYLSKEYNTKITEIKKGGGYAPETVLCAIEKLPHCQSTASLVKEYTETLENLVRTGIPEIDATHFELRQVTRAAVDVICRDRLGATEHTETAGRYAWHFKGSMPVSLKRESGTGENSLYSSGHLAAQLRALTLPPSFADERRKCIRILSERVHTRDTDLLDC